MVTLIKPATAEINPDPVLALNEALALAQDGFATFPCGADKRPVTKHGFLDASADPAVVTQLWRRCPGPLIGVPTGERNDFDVLDVDPNGHNWLAQNSNHLPATLTVSTRRKGYHLFFAHAPGLRCSTGKLACGVDTRGEGGYVIWWAATGCPVLCDAPIAPWPQWLLDRLRNDRKIERATGGTMIPNPRVLGGIIRFVAAAPEGQRNASLFWAACRVGEMVGPNFALGAAAAILVEAAAHCGLSHAEAERTVWSGLRRARHA